LLLLGTGRKRDGCDESSDHCDFGFHVNKFLPCHAPDTVRERDLLSTQEAAPLRESPADMVSMTAIGWRKRVFAREIAIFLGLGGCCNAASNWQFFWPVPQKNRDHRIVTGR